ncbi:MAG: ZIP family metal transporter [Candidatus Berkelbacteria bacterium]|nr:ZIP family metal transporter [Candidatus Berkelbacteria bacterium]
MNIIFLIAILALAATFFGGFFAIRFRDKLHLILGFSAGAVIGVAFFDLLPEAIDLCQKTYDLKIITTLIAGGFVFYLVIDRFFSIHSHGDEECENPGHKGTLGTATLCLHSFLDGLGIGLAFKVSPAVGWIVAAAVLTHDFSDGINTVNMVLKNQGKKNLAIFWLALDAIAPALGIISTLFFTVGATTLGVLLAIFAGFFFYIGASDLIPESHHRHPTLWTTFSTILGITILYFAIRFIG